MKQFYPKSLERRHHQKLLLLLYLLLSIQVCAFAQSCPSGPTTISSNPNTYYPGTTAQVNPGDLSISLGPAATGNYFGSSAINAGDLLLIIQMQGAQIDYSNTSGYGDGVSTDTVASGYLSSPNMVAGNMEYAIAGNSVPTSGGTLTLSSGASKTYMNADYNGTSGQYRYQVIKVGYYYSLVLGATITVAAWNGSAGGVFVVYVINDFNLNSRGINASNAGFRGGLGRQLSGGSGLRTDYLTLASNAANGSKGEGMAGTPQYVINYLNINSSITSGTALNIGVEGYPAGCMAQGAPGTAGGGGTDGNAGSNDQNSGGGGGGNGGHGGKGGKSWSTAINSGGEQGGIFLQSSPSSIVMGGGGGAGTTNDGTGTPSGGNSSSGTPGGGIIIVTTNTISGTGSMTVNGKNGNTTTGNDASGGGGAGGTILLRAKSGTTNVIAKAQGGNGGSNSGNCPGCAASNAQSHGPGGGGGGGIIYSTGPLSASSSVIRGNQGTTVDAILGTNTFGANSGQDGIMVTNASTSQFVSVPVTCYVLPTSFISLNATRSGKDVRVRWAVNNESQTKEYIVERSNDGNNFSEVDRVPSTGAGWYQFPDIAGNTDTVLYYRIEKIVMTGSSEYSRLAVVDVGAPVTEDLTVMPNPVNNTATVKFSSFSRSRVTMRLIGINGMVVWQKQLTASQGYNTFNLDNIATVPNGMYILQLNNGMQVQNAKVIIRH